MTHSTIDRPRSDLPKVHSTSSFVDCPVVQAAFTSCIGIDVHHSILVCAFQYCDLSSNEIRTEICEFGTGASEIQKFACWCKSKKPERIVMESTGILWVSPYQALESVGFTNRTLALINARDFKAVTGRKTDKKDAQNLAEYGRLGKIRSSFVPARNFREMRMVARLYTKIAKELARNKSRYLQLLNFVGCRASTAFSDVNGKAAKAIVEAYLSDAASLPEIIETYGARLRQSPEKIADALSFAISADIRAELMLMRKHLDHLEALKNEQMALLTRMQRDYQAQIDLLTSIPGIKKPAARLILAEVTDDLTSFPNSEHFASWAGVCPGNNESAGKRYSGRAAKGNRHLRCVLIECAQAIGLMRSGELRELFQAFKERRGHRRAVVAIAHRLLLIIYSLLKKAKPYKAMPTDALDRVRVTRYINSARNVKQLNYEILNSGELVDKETGVITAVPL